MINAGCNRTDESHAVVILNFARDLLVDEEAIVEALKPDGKVKKYVTDFPNPTLAGQKDAIVTPASGCIHRGVRG